MNKEEFNYMSKCLIDTMENLGTVRSLHEVYYMKGIIRAYEDVLYKYCDENMLNKLNHMLINMRNVY